MRDVPIMTFLNKLDREGREPFDLLDEIEQSLALDVPPASWPIGMGRDFLGTCDLFADALLLFERGVHDRVTEPVHCNGLDDPKLPRLLPKEALANLRKEVEMAKGLCPPFNAPAYREGHLTPVYFGSALNNFGERELLSEVAEPASVPRPHRLCADLVRPLSVRHEVEEHPHRAPNVGVFCALFSHTHGTARTSMAPLERLGLAIRGQGGIRVVRRRPPLPIHGASNVLCAAGGLTARKVPGCFFECELPHTSRRINYCTSAAEIGVEPCPRLRAYALN